VDRTLRDVLPSPAGKSGWPWTDERIGAPHGEPDALLLPSITIVTPSFNQGQYLEETIRSVLLQGYPNLEYLVMDGGSSDNSLEIIQRYASQLTFWRSEKDGGQSAAIAQGFGMSTGDILGWVNSDDLLLPNCLRRISQYLAKHPKVVCVVGGSITIGSAGGTTPDRFGLPKIVRGERETLKSLLMRGGLSFYQPASFWRREAYFAAGGLDTNLSFAMDYDLYLRLAQLGPFGHIDDLLACFRLHPESKTINLQPVRQRECADLWKRYDLNSIAPAHPGLYRAYLRMGNLARNLPIRVGAALGLVKLPRPGRATKR
jgi:glycosyltransferase involved in cell wall biosynthesis